MAEPCTFAASDLIKDLGEARRAARPDKSHRDEINRAN